MGKYLLLVGVCLSVASVARPARADDMPAPLFTPLPPPEPPPPPPPAPPPPPTFQEVVPTHLRAGNQQFDASVSGLRAYVDATKKTDPKLYAGLEPDVERLEARRNGAMVALAAGAAAGAAAAIGAFAWQTDCSPDTTTAAFSACSHQNTEHLAVLGVLGVAALAAGGITAAAMMPKRSDIMDVVNKHNRLSPQPMQLELGYDPTRRYAYAGAAVPF
jgi:hypothetical protein